jgi:hypothetical protein
MRIQAERPADGLQRALQLHGQVMASRRGRILAACLYMSKNRELQVDITKKGLKQCISTH